jgi:hypothetical protein
MLPKCVSQTLCSPKVALHREINRNERRAFVETYCTLTLSIQEYYPQNLLDRNLILLLIKLQHNVKTSAYTTILIETSRGFEQLN